MFDHKQYVPVLRWKRAERVALKRLSPDVRTAITPLVELVQKDFEPNSEGKRRDPNDILSKKAQELLEHWGNTPILIDVSHLSNHIQTRNGRPLFFQLADNARRKGISMIPVTGLTKSPAFQKRLHPLLLRIDWESGFA